MTIETKTAAELAAEVKGMFDTALAKVQGIADEALGKAKAGETLSNSIKEQADEALTGMNGIKARMDELEQKSVRPTDEPESKSYGSQLTDSDEFKSFLSRGKQGSMRLEMKAITTAAGSAGGLIVSQRETDTVGIPQRPDIVLRDLLTVTQTTSGSIDYPKQSVRTNAAAPVAEGTTKPYSNYGWTRATAPVRTIAHLAKLTRQAVDDAVQLQGEVDAELRYGLRLAEDAQILLGDGTGENLSGLMPNATAYALPTGATTPTTQIDKLRAAMLQSALAFYPATGHVLNPIDWFNIELIKDSAGGYILANPAQLTGPTLWGLPVVPTVSMTAGSFLTGNFRLAATLYDRMAVEVLISSENVDDFEKNLYTMRCEERVALAVKRSAALVKGTF